MPEDTARKPSLSRAESIGYSMKLINGVYNKMIEVFKMQLREDETDEFTKGWNGALTAAIGMTTACKYTKEDFLEMIQESDANETAGSEVPVRQVQDGDQVQD